MRVSSTSPYLLLAGLVVATICQVAHGWTPPQPVVSRRTALLRGLVTAASSATIFVAQQQPAVAATVPSPDEISKLQVGYSRITYLLKNWDKLTTFCGTNTNTESSKQVMKTEDGGGGGNSCAKTPLVIQEYLGYKSINDPLYKADKLMVRAVTLASDPEAYLDAVERYREKSDQVSLMAYTSSWTGANQGFGVEDSLESTKEDVLATERALKEILGYLDLKVLPPSK